MNFRKSKLNVLASAVAVAMSSTALKAADQPALTAITGPLAGASFSAGATVNGGASYLSEIPAGTPMDIRATIKPAAGDVGKVGSLVAALDVQGVGTFVMQSGGYFVPLAQASNLAFATKTLSASEPVTILDDFIGSVAGLSGATISAYVGYYTGSAENLTYTSSPASVTIAAEPSGCPTNTTLANGTFKDKPVCVLTGRITSDTHLTANNSYLLDGQVIIGENTVAGTKTRLTIDAGTTVFGQQGLNFLVIDRNAEMWANGSREAPVIFTYEGDATAGPLTRGQWGGLVINGSAPINEAGGEAEGEGSSGMYGGSNATDSSGSLTYVQVKYAGQNFTETNELNGIAFQGVGSGTNIDYVQVHNNSDDGIEFFGGTANAKHLVLTGNEDDSLDWTLGWNGKVQFVAVRHTNSSEHCIEADNNDDNNDASPRSAPTISNMTCAGDATADGRGLRLREGTAANLSNFVVSQMADYCVDIDQTATFTNAGGSISGLNGNLTLTSTRLASANCPIEDEDGDPFVVSQWFAAQAGSAVGGVDLGGDLGWVNGVQLNAVTPSIPSDSFFEQVDYIGAIKDETSDWTKGWIFEDFLN